MSTCVKLCFQSVGAHLDCSAAPLCRKESVEVVWASGEDAFWSSSWGGVPGTSSREETQVQVERSCTGLGIPEPELVDVAREREVWGRPDCGLISDKPLMMMINGRILKSVTS